MEINVFFKNNIKKVRIYNSFSRKWGDIIKIILMKFHLSIERLNKIILRNPNSNIDIDICDFSFDNFFVDSRIAHNINQYMFILYEFRYDEEYDNLNKKYIDYIYKSRTNQNNNPFYFPSIFSNSIQHSQTQQQQQPTTQTQTQQQEQTTQQTNPRILTRTYTIYPQGTDGTNQNINWSDLTNNLLSIFNLNNQNQSPTLLSEEEINQLENGLYCQMRNEYELESVCPISLRRFDDDDRVIRLPCNHLFMEDSIRTWLLSSNRCPMCRVEINSSSN